MTESTRAEKISRAKSELERYKEDLNELEKNLPAHGLKPIHMMKIEELEDLIDEKEEEIRTLEDS